MTRDTDTLLLACPECGTVTSRTAEWLGSHETVPCYECGTPLPAAAATASQAAIVAGAAGKLPVF
jgi:uncharacterized Zn finger protein